jgi:hypothetical protein
METGIHLPPWCAPVSNAPRLGWDIRSAYGASATDTILPALA